MRPAKYYRLLLSAMIVDFFSGPKPFLQKVAVKLDREVQERGFKLPVPFEIIPRTGVPDTTSLRDFGDPIFPSGERRPSGTVRVLYLVNSAQPYTVSGYTVRTQKLLHEAMQSEVTVYPATRVGYPATIGVVPKGDSVCVDGINYFLLLPSRMSLRRNKNRREAIELLTEIARQLDITLLHTTTDFRNASLISEVARTLGIPWVYEVRGERDKTLELENSGQSSREFLAEFRRRETQAMQAASAVVVLSEVSRRRVEDRGVPKDNIYVVPNGFDLNEAIEAPTREFAREKIGIPSSTKLIGTITSVVDYEGLDSLILALEILDEDTKALIVGSGSALPALKQLAEKRGVADRVVFAGKQDPRAIPLWCAALDVFVLPRRDYEVCRAVTPLKPMLAMGMKIPVVASDLPAVREVTGGLALYVPPDDPEALSDAIREVLADPHNFYSKRLEKFLATRTWQASAQRLIEAYEEIISPEV